MDALPTSCQLRMTQTLHHRSPALLPTLASSGCVNELRSLEAIGPIDYDVGHQPRVACVEDPVLRQARRT